MADKRRRGTGNVRRIRAWDGLRIVAAFDTAAHHVTGDHAVFGVGLPLFLVLSVALSVSRPTPGSFSSFLDKRWTRLLLPWGFWSLLLGGERLVLAIQRDTPALGWFRGEMLLYGPWIHLWFLPAIFLAGVAVHSVHQILQGFGLGRLGGLRHLFSVTAAACLAGVCLTLPVGRAIGWPFEQWLFTLPALPLGWLLGRALAGGKGSPSASRGFLTAAAIGSAAALLLSLFWEPTSAPLVLRYGGALALLYGACLTRGKRWVPDAQRLAPLMLGAYILHPTVHRLLAWLLPSSFALQVPAFLSSYVVTAWVFLVTAILVAALRLTPLRRVL